MQNRTVTKEMKFKRNELSCRPYIRKTYWAIESVEKEEDNQKEADAEHANGVNPQSVKIPVRIASLREPTSYGSFKFLSLPPRYLHQCSLPLTQFLSFTLCSCLFHSECACVCPVQMCRASQEGRLLKQR